MFNHTIFNQRFIRVICAGVLLTAFHLPAQAAAPGTIKISNISEKEIEVVNEDGNKETKRVEVVTALPRDVIIYTTSFENISDKPADNIVITNAVPNDTTYKSASGVNTDISFSIDGGKQYAAPDKLIVTTEENNTRAAVPADYTHMRWIYKGELGVGKTSEVSFRTVIK